MPRLTVGVIGGMGPAATAEFLRLLVEATDATTDQDHLHVIVDSNPTIPDRTAALLDGGEDPTPHLQESAHRLQAAGADLLAIPCNTAHFFIEPIRAAVSVHVVDMIDETVAHLATGETTSVGILAARATLATGLYARGLEAQGLASIGPDSTGQRSLSKAIALVKAGRSRAARPYVQKVANQLARAGADVLLLGCTELPIAVRGGRLPLPAVDPMTILARKVVVASGALLRS